MTNCKLLYCSFCGKSQHEVTRLIAGPSVFICDQCLATGVDIMRKEDDPNWGTVPHGTQTLAQILAKSGLSIGNKGVKDYTLHALVEMAKSSDKSAEIAQLQAQMRSVQDGVQQRRQEMAQTETQYEKIVRELQDRLSELQP